MAFVVVSRDNQELMFNKKPEYDRVEDCWKEKDGEELVYQDYADFSLGVKWADKYFYGIELPPGTIKKLTNKEMTLKDEPIELK